MSEIVIRVKRKRDEEPLESLEVNFDDLSQNEDEKEDGSAPRKKMFKPSKECEVSMNYQEERRKFVFNRVSSQKFGKVDFQKNDQLRKEENEEEGRVYRELNRRKTVNYFNRTSFKDNSQSENNLSSGDNGRFIVIDFESNSDSIQHENQNQRKNQTNEGERPRNLNPVISPLVKPMDDGIRYCMREGGDTSKIEEALSKGCSPNYQTSPSHGRISTLMAVIQARNTPLLRSLLQSHSFDFHWTDVRGMNVMDWAYKTEDGEIVGLVGSHMPSCSGVSSEEYVWDVFKFQRKTIAQSGMYDHQKEVSLRDMQVVEGEGGKLIMSNHQTEQKEEDDQELDGQIGFVSSNEWGELGFWDDDKEGGDCESDIDSDDPRYDGNDYPDEEDEDEEEENYYETFQDEVKRRNEDEISIEELMDQLEENMENFKIDIENEKDRLRYLEDEEELIQDNLLKSHKNKISSQTSDNQSMMEESLVEKLQRLQNDEEDHDKQQQQGDNNPSSVSWRMGDALGGLNGRRDENERDDYDVNGGYDFDFHPSNNDYEHEEVALDEDNYDY